MVNRVYKRYNLGGFMGQKQYNSNLKAVVHNVINAIEKGQDEIFEITEGIRDDCKKMQMELEEIKIELGQIIYEVEKLEKLEKESRRKLYLVSKDFKTYSENDIKDAYEEAREAQIKLILKRQEEKNLIQKRNELEVRIIKNQNIVKKAENMINKMSSIYNFLMDDLESVSEAIITLEGKNQMGLQIIKAQEEERRRIARDIHDGPAQSLASLIIKSEIMNKIADKKNIELLKMELENSRNILKTVLKDIRRIMYDLRPTSLDDLGIVSTIKSIISDLEYEKNIEVELKVINNEKILSPMTSLTVFRIIQECLNNAQKHSRTEKLEIKLDVALDHISGYVRDFGVGFDPAKKKGTFGLSSMKERAELLNGNLNIESYEGKGTKINFKLPNLEVDHE